MSISTNTALQTNLDSNFLPLLAVCFLRLVAVRFSTSCGFLRLDFELLAFQKFLRVNRKNTTFLRLAAACVFLRRKLAPLLARARTTSIKNNDFIIYIRISWYSKLFTLFITVKTITKLNHKHSDKFEIKI